MEPHRKPWPQQIKQKHQFVDWRNAGSHQPKHVWFVLSRKWPQPQLKHYKKKKKLFMIYTWGSSTKKLTHSDSTLKSIQNWSSFSSLGLKSCRRKIWRQSCEATVRESHVNIGWLEKVSTDNGILYLSLFQVGTDAGEGENPDRQKRGRIKKIKRSKQFYV